MNVNSDEIDIVFNTILNLYKADVVRQKIKQKLQVSLNEKLLLYILGSFADFSELEFEQIVAQTLSPTGIVYHKTVNAAFEAVMSEASVK